MSYSGSSVASYLTNYLSINAAADAYKSLDVGKPPWDRITFVEQSNALL